MGAIQPTPRTSVVSATAPSARSSHSEVENVPELMVA